MFLNTFFCTSANFFLNFYDTMLPARVMDSHASFFCVSITNNIKYDRSEENNNNYIF